MGDTMNFLHQLLGCTHRFSWPRVDDEGRHYQICLSCGVAYEYDWKVMRRTDRPFVVGSNLHKAGIPQRKLGSP